MAWDPSSASALLMAAASQKRMYLHVVQTVSGVDTEFTQGLGQVLAQNKSSM